jgi:hypothetical protein
MYYVGRETIPRAVLVDKLVEMLLAEVVPGTWEQMVF